MAERILAVITARGGSKGLPGKNLRPLLAKPLIGWTVEAAVASEAVDRVVVSSDDEAILRVAAEHVAETPFVRPAELSGDLAKQEDAVLHAMDWVERDEGRAYDGVMLLAPTNPLRDAVEIDAVAAHWASQPQARAVMTVVPCEHHPAFANTLPDDDSMADFIAPELRTKNRQELPPYFRICGSVCLSEWAWFHEHQTFVTPATYAFVTSRRNGTDVDSLADFAVAEAYASQPDLR